MRIIREIPSRSGGVPHSVREDDFGNLFCTCAAGRHEMDCWAVREVRGERIHEERMARLRVEMNPAARLPVPYVELVRRSVAHWANEAFWREVEKEYRSNFPQPEPPVVTLGNKGYFDDGLEEPRIRKRRNRNH